ncbi:MAG: TetR/AcrR family transcriptional regulator [Deltaproteobacteria bacterium]|nr:MAG: TetR/AcrR family transcriptional regulator [Deltaproteobacteria bacterium]
MPANSINHDEVVDPRALNVESSSRAQQILLAADELLAERGHDAVSMRDVAQRAGVNKALIFYYFGSRAQLFEKVLERYYDNHTLALQAIRDTSGTPRERLHRALDAYLDFVEDNELFSRLVQQELARQDPQLHVIRENLTKLHEALHDVLGAILPKHGPMAARQLYMTIGCLMVHHGTFATSPLAETAEILQGQEGRAERREHVHWLADVVFERMESELSGR